MVNGNDEYIFVWSYLEIWSSSTGHSVSAEFVESRREASSRCGLRGMASYSEALEVSLFSAVVLSVCGYYVLVPKVRRVKTSLVARAFGGVWGGSIFFFFVAIALGAPLFTKFYETMVFSLMMATFVVLPFFLVFGLDFNVLWKIYITGETPSNIGHFIRYTGLGSFAGAWIGAAAIPLDWNRPWQKWPISVFAGGWVGYLVGFILHTASTVRA